jgi:UDP-N-acetylglucosamine 2-epimerase (non-hydrolysing)
MPEEINRLVTDALADLLFTPSEDADQNLLREGVLNDKIRCVGNIMIDTMVDSLEKARNLAPYINYGLEKKQYVFVTLHRPSNVDNRETLGLIMQNLADLSKQLPVIFPVHPRTKKNIIEWNLKPKEDRYPDLKLCNPVGYFESIGLADMAKFVLTDSGGLQEETTFLKVPCLTLRPNTERPVTINYGTNQLTSLNTLQTDLDNLSSGKYKKGRIPQLWDGKTSKRIIEILVQK